MRELEGNCLRGWPGGHLRERFPRLLLGRSHSLKADPCYQPHHLTSGQRLKCPPRGGWFPRECQDAVAFSDHHWPRLLGAQAPLRQWEKFSLCRVINLPCRPCLRASFLQVAPSVQQPPFSSAHCPAPRISSIIDSSRALPGTTDNSAERDPGHACTSWDRDSHIAQRDAAFRSPLRLGGV